METEAKIRYANYPRQASIHGGRKERGGKGGEGEEREGVGG